MTKRLLERFLWESETTTVVVGYEREDSRWSSVLFSIDDALFVVIRQIRRLKWRILRYRLVCKQFDRAVKRCIYSERLEIALSLSFSMARAQFLGELGWISRLVSCDFLNEITNPFYVALLPFVKRLSIKNCGFSADGLRHLTQLESLSISRASTADYVHKLGHWSNLRRLRVIDSEVAMSNVWTSLVRLDQLSIGSYHYTAERRLQDPLLTDFCPEFIDGESLRLLTNIRVLSLHEPQLSVFPVLGNDVLPHLRSLSLKSRHRMTENKIQLDFSRLTLLESLSLSHGTVYDMSFSMSSLQLLNRLVRFSFVFDVEDMGEFWRQHILSHSNSIFPLESFILLPRSLQYCYLGNVVLQPETKAAALAEFIGRGASLIIEEWRQ